MKRLALVLAAAVLGAGCVSSSSPPPPAGNVDFSWSFVRTLATGATTTYGCNLAGIDNVVVAFPGGTVQVNCADAAGDGALVAGITPGTQTVTVTGQRGSHALYSGQTTVTVYDGQNTPASVQAYGIQSDLDVNAYFLAYNGGPGWSTCANAGVSTLTYSLVDYASTVVASGSVSCTDPAGVSFVGAYGLDRDNYAIRMRGLSGSSVTFDSATEYVSPTCSGQAFNHFGTDTGGYAWNVDLYDITLNGTNLCP